MTRRKNPASAAFEARCIQLTKQEQKHWATEMEVDPRGVKFYNRSLFGRTAGMLGYGALGRESARLLKAHGMRIVAANTTGKSAKFEDWTPEGTGDLDGESANILLFQADQRRFDS